MSRRSLRSMVRGLGVLQDWTSNEVLGGCQGKRALYTGISASPRAQCIRFRGPTNPTRPQNLPPTLVSWSISSTLHDAAYPAALQSEEEDTDQQYESFRVDNREDETIVALSSGAGRSAVAVTRISGPCADDALLKMLSEGSSLPAPRQAALRSLHDPQSKQLLDKALVLRFPAPASFTGEDIVEIQGHGGPAVVRTLLSALTTLPGLRLAEAGEFTRRAFLAGKMDLTEVEGLADLLAAETQAQHLQALQQSSGRQRRQYDAWRKTLINCLAHVEAVLDFGDDNDIDSDVAAEIFPAAHALRLELQRHLQDGKRGEFLRNGLKIALVGPPNAGKSTVLNLLAGRDAAIVSPIPGTTRDTVEVLLELAGHKVIVMDTAGLRKTGDSIEAEGVSRAKQAAQDADIVIAVADCTDPEPYAQLVAWTKTLNAEDGGMPREASPQQSKLSAGWSSNLEELYPTKSSDWSHGAVGAKPIIALINKLDLRSETPFQARTGISEEMQQSIGADSLPTWLQADLRTSIPAQNNTSLHSQSETATLGSSGREQTTGNQNVIVSYVGISASTGEGGDLLIKAIEGQIQDLVGSIESGEGYLITRLRHRQHVQECVDALLGYEQVRQELDLAAEELRYAARALGKITGAIDIDHVLNTVFSEFCIGK